MILEIGTVDMVSVAKEVLTRHADEVALALCPLSLSAPPTALGEWDRMRVEQVVTNLVTNAIKYGRGKPVEIRIEENEREVRLMVSDHGIGVSKEDQARMFQRFERATNARKLPGFGLGLWIVKQIVESHRGEIHIESELGVGSTFTVTLPRALP
jgi:signal transduction histidine kinase